MAEHQQAHKSSESKTASQRQAIPRIPTPVSHPMAIIQRARINPKSLTHADVLQLQSTIGNRAVVRLLTEIGAIPSKAKQAPPVQMQTIPEEEKEPLQGKMVEIIQCQEIPEKEEPLQGKFAESIQLQKIPEEEEPLQGKFESRPEKEICPSCIQRQEIPEEKELLQTKKENNTGMPDNLKAGVENISGIDMNNVRVHYNSSKPAEVGAFAYTQGTAIHVAPGQESHLPHEAWHVIQQAQGRVRPTLQLKNMTVNDDMGLEREADKMGERANQMKDMSVKEQALNFTQTKPTPIQKIIQCARLTDIGNTDLSPELKQQILTFIHNDLNNDFSFAKQGVFDILGTNWTYDIRVDLAGAEHGGNRTPHIHITQATRELSNQNFDNVREATETEIRQIVTGGANGPMPDTILAWVRNIFTVKETERTNPPQAMPPADLGGDLFGDDT
jgi:hypothetical protein